MAVVVDAATYDVVEQDARALGIADAPADGPGSKVTIVYKRVDSRWKPWVAVTRSCALASAGLLGLGLYTLQDLRPRSQTRLGYRAGTRIGRYTGAVLGSFADANSREAKQKMAEWARSGKAHLLLMKISGRAGVSVVDGKDGGPPFLQYANDARKLTGYVNNIQFSTVGVATATRAVPAADLDTMRSFDDIAGSELLASYGESFWRVHETLGQQQNPVVLDRGFAPALLMKL
jgi:hypothetical protein